MWDTENDIIYQKNVGYYQQHTAPTSLLHYGHFCVSTHVLQLSTQSSGVTEH